MGVVVGVVKCIAVLGGICYPVQKLERQTITATQHGLLREAQNKIKCKKERQCSYNVTLRSVRVATFAVVKQ